MAERAGGSRALSAGELGGVLVRGIWSARECYCAVFVTVRRRWFDIVMLSSCALSEGVTGDRFFTLRRGGAPASERWPMRRKDRTHRSALNSSRGLSGGEREKLSRSSTPHEHTIDYEA